MTASGEASPRWSALFVLGAFLVPTAIWCAVSYIPWLWHPLVEVTDPGGASVRGQHSYLEAGQLVDREVFAAREAELAAAGAAPPRGEPRNPIYLPAPHEVARALYTAFTTAPARHGDMWLHDSLWASCRVIFLGFLYSALVGVPLGILCGVFRPLSRLVEPFVDFVRYMPAPVFGALAVAILGLADGPKIAIVFIGTFFQMVLVVANTARSIDRPLVESGQTLGARGHQLLLHVVLPGILPRLFRDMRILLGWAWTYLVVAELIGEKSGISAFLYQQQRYRNFDNVYAGIIIIGLIGLMTDQLLARLERVWFPWVYGPSRLRRWLTSAARWIASAAARGAPAAVPAAEAKDR